MRSDLREPTVHNANCNFTKGVDNQEKCWKLDNQQAARTLVTVARLKIAVG